jgi:hypothetical protein
MLCTANQQLVVQKVKEERNILHTVKRRKANWIGHILRMKCLLKQVTEEKIKESDGKTWTKA